MRNHGSVGPKPEKAGHFPGDFRNLIGFVRVSALLFQFKQLVQVTLQPYQVLDEFALKINRCRGRVLLFGKNGYLELGEVKTAMEGRGMELCWEESLVDYLVKKGYSVTYGARNLRRLIQKEIEDLIAGKLIELRGAEIKKITLFADEGGVKVEV